ncbi:MAG: fibronectin type III domain-containing protein, partial [Flavobacteriales bacterium]|nr:fibronectin type III domain-containing protein [Flavobacteriales bacterium]
MDIFYDIINLGNSDTWIVIVAACLLSFMHFATLGFLFAKHREEEPTYLMSLDKVKSLENAWTLLLLLIIPLIFIYNLFVWSGYAFVVIAQFSAYLIKAIYDLIVDYIVIPFIDYIVKPIWEFLKTIFPIWKIVKWIVSSIIWVFWNIFWMPIRIVLKSLYHYCILWVWDLYLTSFQSLKGTYKMNKLRITFSGAFYALAIIGLSIYLSILTGFVVLGMIGVVVATLPSIKAYGTLTSMLHFTDDRDHTVHGSKVMKTALNYVITSIAAIVVIELMLLLSWLPDLGLVFLGLAINTNVFLSAIVVLSLFVLFFAQAIFPNHLLYNDESTSMQDSIVNYLYVIRDKGVQLIASLVPGSLWMILVIVIPAALIYGSISISESLKNNTLSVRGENIQENIIEANSEVTSLAANFTSDQLDDIEDAFETAIELNVRSNQNTFGLGFPQNIIEQPEVIFSDNTTEYTAELPKMLTGAINDTLQIVSDIKNAEALIQKLTNHISEYKDQQWEFKIQRKSTNGEWKTISSGTDISSVVDKNITEGKSYTYRVQAINKNGKSAWSSDLGKSIGKDDLTPPSLLRISNEFNFRLVLTWNDNSTNEDGFIIERRTKKDNNVVGEWKELAVVGSDVSQHIANADRSPGKTYDYRVLALGLDGKSKPTNMVTKKVILKSPSRLKANANLKSALVDWAYGFGYDKTNL